MKSPVLAASLAVFIWGASPPATMLAAGSIPPHLIGALRSIVAAAIMLPAIFFFWRDLPKKACACGELVLGGLSSFALYPLLLSIGVAQTSVLHASLILATAPISTGLVSFMLSGSWPRWTWWSGAIISMGGVTLLVSATTTDIASSTASLRGDGLVLLSVLFASFGYIFGGRSATRMGKWPATFWMLLVGALSLTPFFLVPAIQYDWGRVTIEAAAGLVFLVVAVTIVGYALWFWALGAGNAASIAPLQFGQPLVGIGLGVAFFGEPFTALILLSGGLILCGVVVSSRN